MRKLRLLLLAAVSAGAQTLIEPRIVSETLPAGSLMQIKLGFTSPHPITTSGADFAMDFSFDGVEGVAMMSPSGDGYGVAVVQGQSFRSNLVSPLASLGTQLDYPFLTIATKIKPGLAVGTKIPINFGSTTFFNGPGGAAYAMPAAKNGVLTIGGSVSVTNVIPGGGQLPAGTVIRLLGTGFNPDTRVDVGEATISREVYVSPTEIQLTLGVAANMTGKRIRVRNRDNSEAEYYSYLRAVAVGASTRPLLNASHPLYQDQTTTSAGVVLPAAPANGFVAVALRNMALTSVTAQLQLVSSAGAVLGSTSATLPGGSQFMRTAQEMFGSSPAGATVRVTSSGALQVLGVRGDEATGNVTAFLAGAAPAVTSELVVTPGTLVFDVIAGGAAPPVKSLSVNSTGSAISYTVASNASWLTVLPVAGTTPGANSIGVNPAGLAAGTYSGTLTFAAAGSATQTVAVTLNVAPAAQLNVAPAALSFAASGSQTVAVTSTGASLPFTVTSNAAWLTATPASGNTPGSLTVTANTAGLAPGSYSGLLTVAAGSTSRTVTVSLTVPAPQLTVTPATLAISGSGTQTVSLTSSGAAVSYTATTNAPWLTVAPATGTAPASVSVTANGTGLAPGTYTGQVTFAQTAAGSTAPVVTVTLTVTAAPQLTLTPGALTFTAIAVGAAPPAKTISVGSTGTPISFRASTLAPWMTVTPAAGQTPGTVTVTVNPAGLAAGSYPSLITIEPVSGGTPQTVLVSLEVAPPAQMVLNPATLAFDAPFGGAAVSKNLAISSTVAGLTYSASSNAAWLTVSPTSGQTPATLTITANATGLVAGSYTGAVTVTPIGGVPQTVSATLNVIAAPVLVLAPVSLAFDGAGTRSLSVSSSGAPLSFTAGTNAAWLMVTPGSGQTPATLTVTANPAGLAAGQYSATLTVNGQPVPVTLTVAAAASPLRLTPTALQFNYAETGALPAAQEIRVDTGNVETPFTVSTSVNWLSVRASRLSTPAMLTVSATPQGLPSGTYTSSISIRAAAGQTQSLAVTLVVGAGSRPEVGAVVSGASQLVGQPLAPGQIVTIYGDRLGPAVGQGVILNGTRFIETLNSGTRVWFGSTPAPILYTSARQVNAIVPYEVSGATRVEVEYLGQRSIAGEVTVAPAAPAIFTQSASGLGRAAVLNQNYSLNTPQQRAARGSVIMIYATGGGQTTPPSATGEVAGSDLRTVLAPVTVTIGGRRVEPLYAGVAPGLVTGLMQVNVLIPAGAPAGDAVPITIEVGGEASRDGTTIAIE